MTEIDGINFSVSNSIEIFSFTMMLLGVWMLSSLLSLHYNKFFPHISRSQSMGKTLIMISTITFLIITVVKSSLALSLGLVGALSIIRFRTPIKEPFELSYLFMSIAIGLGFGANQWLPTSIVIIFSLVVLIFYSKNSNNLIDGSYFIYMDFEKSENDMEIEDILLEIGKNINVDMNLRRVDRNLESTKITINALISSNEDLVKLNKDLVSILKPTSISIVDNQKLMPF
jgi:uncharacterized membrane protein YhiD involved in acid resistance